MRVRQRGENDLIENAICGNVMNDWSSSGNITSSIEKKFS